MTKNKIIFDFDQVLFLTRGLFECLRKEFIKRGVDEKLFYESFEKSKDKVGYSPDKQFEIIIRKNPKINIKILRGSFKKVMDKSELFLFPDVLPLLKNLKKENELIILSYGDKKFQKEKIEKTKISEYFDKIIITQEINKISELKKILEKDETAIFIEDNPNCIYEVKNRFPNLITIRINRKEGKYAEEPDNPNIDFVIKSLEDINNIL